MKFRPCCVHMCIHFILSRANWLLGHHASRCVIGGTRIKDYTPWRVVMHTYVKILCHHFVALCFSKSEIGSLPELGMHPENNCKQRQTRASQCIFAQGNSSMHHPSFGTELRQSIDLRANLLLSLINLLINKGFVIIRTEIIYSWLYIIYSDPPREGNVVISVRVCDVCLPTPRLSPFYLPAYDG